MNSSDLQSWHPLRSRIESDMQCQPANPRANQLQRDANLSGSQQTPQRVLALADLSRIEEESVAREASAKLLAAQ